MFNQKLKLWALVIIFVLAASFATTASSRNEARAAGRVVTFEIEFVFKVFFDDMERAFDRLFRSFEKILEKMFDDIEKSFKESLEEISGGDGNDGANTADKKGDGKDGRENPGGGDDGTAGKQPGNDENTDGRDTDFRDDGARENKNNDIPELGGDDGNRNGDLTGGRNIGSNPWDILNKRAQNNQNGNDGRDPGKPQNQGNNVENTPPPAPQPPVPQPPQPPKQPEPPVPQPPVPPLPPNNGGQNVNNNGANNNFKDPFDWYIKQQQQQEEAELDKHRQTEMSSDAFEMAKKIKADFGIEICNAEYAWTAEELQTTYQILSELPKSFIAKTRTLSKGSADKVFPGMSNIGGFASGSSVTITPLGLRADYKRVLIHEMGHCFHFQTYELQNQFQQKFWSGRNGYSGSAGGANPPAISQYGGSNVMEDMAEAIAYYVVYGKSMKQMSPERYELVKNLVMEGKEW